MRLYAIGDVHGQIDKLLAAHMHIARDREATGDEDAPVIHLGDLCDRGPNSRAVFDFLLAGIEAGAPWRSVRGNHDWMMQNFLAEDPPDEVPLSGWIGANMGGAATLASYGVESDGWSGLDGLREAARKAVPEAHVRFLQAMPRFVETGELILVHAGIRPGIPLERQSEDDLYWIRSDFLDDMRDHGRLVVHGHTPVEDPMHCGNRVNLDTGAAWGGPVTAAVFEDRACWILGPEGRTALRPRS